MDMTPGKRRSFKPIPFGFDSRPCARCDERMAIGKQVPKGVRRHVARHLCNGCYPTVAKAGELNQFGRITCDSDQLASRVEALLAEGKTLADCARIFATPRTTLDSALRRHRALVENGESHA
jgi:hypothetical protein